MRSNPCLSLIEPLEARIAPAVIYIGGTAKYSDTHNNIYKTTPGSGGNYDPSDPFGANYVGGDHTYYVKLVKGDSVSFLGDQLVKVNSGTAVLFFTDINPDTHASDNTYENGELTGMSFGKNANVVIKGSVYGDIVGNYDDALGKIVPVPKAVIPGSPAPDDAKWWTGQTLSSLVVDDANQVISGGNINNVTGKVVGRILAGDSANGFSYDFNYLDVGGVTPLTIAMPDKVNGASISNVSVSGIDVMHAGNGGSGASGGSISKVTLTSDINGFLLAAGAGGSGNADITKAGAGGGVSKIYHIGVNDTSANSSGFNPVTFLRDSAQPAYQYLGGAGGNGYNDGLVAANGGAGGKLDQVYDGYQVVSGQVKASTYYTQDSVLLQGGHGGSGTVGGNGGGVSNSKVLSLAPNDTNPSDPVYEIKVAGGDGGANVLAVSKGKSGSGGALSKLDVQNLGFQANLANNFLPQILLHGGNAGSTLASGGAGGSVSGATLLGYKAEVIAGDGVNGGALAGTTGGSGGSLSSVTVPFSSEGILPHNLSFVTGRGGDSQGNAGSGGAMSKVKVDHSDLASLVVTTGQGGQSATGKGGSGGSLSDSNITDIDSKNGISGAFALTAGVGGNGTVGGNGGAINKFDFAAEDLSFTVVSGAGGNGSKGSGGNGGAISSSGFNTSDDNGAKNYAGSIRSGAGGNGTGLSHVDSKGKTVIDVKASGGAGGNLSKVNGKADLSVQIFGGNGGNGDGNKAGSGASMDGVAADAAGSSALLRAGNAGAGGALLATSKADGGTIKNSQAFGHSDVTIIAGDGALGGAGGSIQSVGFGDAATGQEPLGKVTVAAGAGSSGPSTAGAGGSIKTLTGFVGDTGVTRITAGNGAGSTDLLKAGSGGSITDLVLNGGGNHSGTELQIQAGDAGNSTSAKTGANGGSIKGVSVEALGATALFRYVVAGDGGNASVNGGAGGTIDSVHANSDIGVRSGAQFGYGDTAMGGLFAGRGGSGSSKTGVSGSVTNISADAIAAIVAGKLKVGDIITGANLANKVDRIYLTGTVLPVVTANGSMNNWNSANMVGAIIDPTSATANVFNLSEGEWVDVIADNTFGIGDRITSKTDGFIAAVNYPVNNLSRTNFFAEALLTVANAKLPASPSNSQFLDNTDTPITP